MLFANCSQNSSLEYHENPVYFFKLFFFEKYWTAIWTMNEWFIDSWVDAKSMFKQNIIFRLKLDYIVFKFIPRQLSALLISLSSFKRQKIKKLISFLKFKVKTL